MQNTTLRKLTPAQWREYESNGFVVVPDLIPVDELRRIDDEITEILARKDSQPNERSMLLRLGLRSGLMHQIASDPRILSLVEEIVKPGIAIYSSKMVAKVPGDQRLCHWHQDDAYYSQKSQSQTRMSIWLGLHDSDETNGGVWFVPGSHKTGLRQHSHEGGLCSLSLHPTPAETAGAVCPPVKAGSMVLFSAMTWHFSAPNTSDRLRRAFIVSYQEATVVGGNADQWKILRPAV
jgi:ectoine hydroxylase-related dioxygenase (phytanoyl-CoA dioxygenase family)